MKKKKDNARIVVYLTSSSTPIYATKVVLN